MEMPINIIVTLVVALAVGASIMYFAKDTILRSGDELRDLGKAPKAADLPIITVASVSQQQVRDLTRQCGADVAGAVDMRLCYVLRSTAFDSAIPSLDGDTFTAGQRTLQVSVSAAASADITAGTINALFIYYNPLGTIDIES